jgi:site-specific DNA-cytosine methylase
MHLFFTGIGDKYRQIGNAVPPPLARAIGVSILCAQAETEAVKMLY